MYVQDAQRALSAANGKLVRGRKIVVTYAQQASLDNVHSSLTGSKFRKAVNEAGRPTTLSLLKAGEGHGGRSDGYVITLIYLALGDLKNSSQHEEQDRTHGSKVEADGPNNSKSEPGPSPVLIAPATPSSRSTPCPSHTSQALT